MHATIRPHATALFGAVLSLCASASAQSLLHDQGPLVTHPGGGVGGADVSALDNSTLWHPAHTVLGFGAQRMLGYSVADEFTVCGAWTVSDLEFFVYQTLATPPTITGVYARIWDGDPRTGGVVRWGDLTTNLLPAAPAGSLHCYRAALGSILASDRAVVRIRVPVQGLLLPAGVYWIEMQFTGSAASGPWVPPVTETGTYSTGHAIQHLVSTWVTLDNAAPGGAGVSLPFRVLGTTSQPAPRPAQQWYGVARPETGQVPAWGESTPVVGRETMLRIADGAPGSPPIVLLGTRLPGIAVPPFGTLYVSPLASLLLPPFDPLTLLSSRPLQIPHGSGLCGVELAFQGFWIDPATPGGVAHTGGMMLRLGTFSDTISVDRLIEVEVGAETQKVLPVMWSGATVSVLDPSVATAELVPWNSGLRLKVRGVRSGQTILLVRDARNQSVRAFHVTVP